MKQFIKGMVKSAWRTILPASARSSLRLWVLLDTPDFSPRLIKEFTADPVVVLAPHMDDEVIGPGGAVLRHVEAGAAVTFVFMTDGAAGGRSLIRVCRRYARRRARRQRIFWASNN